MDNRYLQSAVITIATLAGLELISRFLVQVPPVPIYLVVVALCSTIGGLHGGILSGLMTLAHASYFFSDPGQLFRFDPDNLQTVILLAIITPSIVLLVSTLKLRANARHQETWKLRDELEARSQELSELQMTKEICVHMLAHELRHPQTVFIGFTELARSRAESIGETQLVKSLVRASEGYHELNRIISNLLDLIRLEEKKMSLKQEELDLSVLVDEKIPLFAGILRNRHIDLKWSHPLWLPLVKADQDLIGRVIENLLANAVERTPVNGVIQIAVATAFGPGIEVMVKDSGEEIPVGEQVKLFQKFEQVGSWKLGRRSSSGLALVVCQMAVEAHGGTIWIKSRPGGGSTFIFRLPMISA